MNKTIVIGCDHAALDLKLKVKAHVESKGYTVIDVGTHTNDSCNYPDYAHAACEKIRGGEAVLGILICGTGIGMSMAANKHRGIRAAVCSDTFSARMTRMHNDANVLALGARVLGEGLALKIVETFLNTEFEGGRHARRVALIHEIEENN